MMDWEKKWPELEGLSDLERFDLLRAAKKRMYSNLTGAFSLLIYFLAAVGLGVATTQLPRLFLDGTLWLEVLFWIIGIFLAIYLFERLYSNRLRRAVGVIHTERESESEPPS
ncbi:MAG: hypothetical protein ACXIUM_06835 [Wenzhouxiangella sp.]